MTVTRDQAARMGGALFTASGLLVLVNNYTPASDHLNRGLLSLIGAAAIAVGLLVWFVIPWDRLPSAGTLSLPLIGLSLIGFANSAGGVSAHSYSAFFILIAAYIGTTQRRGTTTAFALPMAGVYMAALAFRADATPAAVWSVTVVIPVCVLVGEVIARALARAELARAASDRRARLLAVSANAARAVHALDGRKVMRAVADSAEELGYDGVTVEVLERDRSGYRCVEARGLPDDFTGSRHRSGDGITGQVLLRKAQTVMTDYKSDLRVLPQLRELGFEVVIGTPIWVRSEIAAVLNVGSKRSLVIDPSELEALELLAGQAGRALELAGDFVRQGRERRRFRREALVDDLTGLGNRRRAEQLIDTARAGDAIAMLDLDDFKRLNDTQGHGAGDRVLAQLGDFLRRSLRGGDVAARYGGEEFIVIIRRPGNDLHDVFERLRFEWVAGEAPVTFSVGTAVIGHAEASRAALARADKSLLSAKRRGKNCVRHSDVLIELAVES